MQAEDRILSVPAPLVPPSAAVPQPPQSEADDSASDTESSFESFFREPELAQQAPLAWALTQRQPLIDAVRGLLGGPQAAARLRLWCFMELASQPQGRLQREDIQQLFHVLKPEALDTALRRLRELGLLVWDTGSQDYRLSPLAQQVQGLLAPLTRSGDADDEEMAALLAQVAGAQALGLADASQLRHLHAQLTRLHDEFAEAITSGSEARLRAAAPRFERALALVARAGEALTALIRGDARGQASNDAGGEAAQDVADARLEREARALGQAQARLLTMASQFTRALQQADRQRVTLGSTGVTSSDVRAWLQAQLQQHGPAFGQLLEDALASTVRPVFVSPHDLLDVTEAEFERDRPDPDRPQGLPPAVAAQPGTMETLRMPTELDDFIHKLAAWNQTAARPHDLQEAVLGETDSQAPGAQEGAGTAGTGRYAQAAYRMQLLPLLGDAQARTLKGQTGDFARSPWRVALSPQTRSLSAQEGGPVATLSEGQLYPENTQFPETGPDESSTP
ncbi:hypothetical protein [Hylemonella gracilis]|uniref:Uncharacterized protein n=1 Tax=Hylemonella gracilis ATCC 19624 TaxID=887062 RepID=F3KVK1_9BURK|nr:hypothetical protein [Hylemonella gracilis]EGI76184.1 hypothetical protein HGR_12442 [Hylemonella gracilis ATCC 19624]